MVTGLPSTLSCLLLATAAAASSASANCTNPNPLLCPPGPFSATMKLSFTGPISPKAASSPASVHVYGRFRTNTVVGPPIARANVPERARVVGV